MTNGPNELSPKELAFANRFYDIVSSSLVPVRIVEADTQREVGFKGASGSFIYLNGYYYCLTAAHVLKDYIKQRSESKQHIILVIDNIPLAEVPMMWERGKDIGLILMPPETLTKIRTRIYETGENWRPTEVDEGEGVLFVGYPKFLRVETNDFTVWHTPLALYLPVVSKQPNYFTLQMDVENLTNAGNIPLPPEGTSFAGVSGCPVWVPRQERPYLVGVFSQEIGSLPLYEVSTLESLEGFTPSL